MDNLKKLYAKDIEREIQGVIKVDDESYISQELEEYVVTEELLKHFNSFFDAYNTGINGNTVIDKQRCYQVSPNSTNFMTIDGEKEMVSYNTVEILL